MWGHLQQVPHVGCSCVLLLMFDSTLIELVKLVEEEKKAEAAAVWKAQPQALRIALLKSLQQDGILRRFAQDQVPAERVKKCLTLAGVRNGCHRVPLDHYFQGGLGIGECSVV
jgi:hypothetical protein